LSSSSPLAVGRNAPLSQLFSFGFVRYGYHSAAMPDDAALLRQFADDHSEAAFAELVHRHLDAVYSSAVRRLAGDTHLAEDVTQHVFIALARHARTVATHPAMSAWLHLTTRNIAAQTIRAEQRRRAREQHAAMPDSSPDPSAAADWTRLAPVIDDAIDRLNDRDRSAILLRFIERRAFADIGCALRISEDAARMRVDRALNKLRTALAIRGVTSTSAALAVALTGHGVTAAPAGLSTTAATVAFAAAPASTSAIALFSAMTTSKASLTVAATAALIAIGTATHERIRALDADFAMDAARHEHLAGQARLDALHREHDAITADIDQLNRRLSNLSSAPGSSASGNARATAPRPVPFGAVKPDPAADAFMERHPAVKQALIAWVDAKNRYEWRDFYVQCNLTPAQIARLEELMREEAAMQRPLGPDGQYAVFSAGSEGLSRDEAEAKIRELLGPENYAKRSVYSAKLPARAEASGIAAALGFTATPLSPEQAQHLVDLIHHSRPPGLTRGVDFDWEAIRTKASDVLSPAQLTVIDRMRAQSEYDAAFSHAMSVARSTTAASP
jgi:RNA polymerase sigma factor (sigma-70 family)